MKKTKSRDVLVFGDVAMIFENWWKTYFKKLF